MKKLLVILILGMLSCKKEIPNIVIPTPQTKIVDTIVQSFIKIKTEYESGIHSFFSLSYEWVRNARNSVIDNLLSYDSSNNLWYSFFNLSWSMSYPNLKPQNRRVFYSIRMVQ